MWPRHLPQAGVTFDKFHAVKIVNDAVDEVRREEQKSRPELKRDPLRLAQERDQPVHRPARTASTASPTATSRPPAPTRIRLAFQELYQQPIREAAEAFLKKWYFWATHSRLQPMIEAAKTIKRHWDGILRWFDSKIANGLIEGINSLVQAAKAKARGYRSTATSRP